MPSFHELLQKYLDGTLSAEEKELFMEWLQDSDHEQFVKGLMDLNLDSSVEEDLSMESLGKRIFLDLNARIIEGGEKKMHDGFIHPGKRRLYKILLLAAASILLCAVGIWYKREGRPVSNTMALRKASDILPGGNKALLVLGGGTTINLDSAKNGMLLSEGGTAVKKDKDGQLSYNGPKGDADVSFNKLITPKGGQYEVVLPDGSKVWLNAASTLTYPTAFVGKERKVQLEGEAYFEVASDPGKPFLVSTADMQVEVLGTSFDLMAYEGEENTKGTLLQGSIKALDASGAGVLLKPGQEASLDHADGKMNVQPADTEEAVAWKEGMFLYNRQAGIQEVMRQLARWYDIEVHYSGPTTGKRFYGGIQKGLPLSQVLSILERTGVRFNVEGRDITVTSLSENQ